MCKGWCDKNLFKESVRFIKFYEYFRIYNWYFIKNIFRCRRWFLFFYIENKYLFLEVVGEGGLEKEWIEIV